MKKSLSALLLLSLLLGAALPAQAAETELELKVKAALLYNFARHFSWPAGKFATPGSPLQICVLEPDPFGAVLDSSLAGKKVDTHPLTLRRASTAAELRDCHMVYAGGADGAALEAAFAELRGAAVVTVHDSSRALRGGVVRFFREERKVRFEINTLAAVRENLELSPKLQNLAITVRK